MTSQLVIFRAFLFIFFRPLTLNLKKNPVNELIRKSLTVDTLSILVLSRNLYCMVLYILNPISCFSMYGNVLKFQTLVACQKA